MSESVAAPVHSAGNALTRKMGPLPVWVWALIAVALVWGVYAYRTMRGVNTGGGGGTPATVAGANSVPYNAQEPVSGYSGSVQSGSGVPGMSTNAQWARQAADQLIAFGDDPSKVETALSQYVNGQTLDQGGQSIIDQALTKFGNPPQGVLPLHTVLDPLSTLPFKDFVGYDRDPTNGAIYGVDKAGTLAWLTPDQYKALGSPGYNSVSVDGIHPAAPPPPPPPPPAPAPTAPQPAPPAQRFYTVQPGDSLSAITGRYTGDMMRWNELYNANRGVVGGNPDLIYPGQRLVIPF